MSVKLNSIQINSNEVADRRDQINSDCEEIWAETDAAEAATITKLNNTRSNKHI